MRSITQSKMNISYKYKFKSEKTPQVTFESDDYKIYYDTIIITDKVIHHNEQDITTNNIAKFL